MDRSKMIDFLTEKIFEESKDAGMYMEHSVACSDTTIKSTLNKIAEDELNHQKMLIKLLADIAKQGIMEVKNDGYVS